MFSLTDKNFEEVISKNEKPVLVDFFALWCNPCSFLSPLLDKIAEEYKAKIIFTKANLDEVPLAAKKYGVEMIPFVILFNQGKPIGGFIGMKSEAAIKEILDKALENI